MILMKYCFLFSWILLTVSAQDVEPSPGNPPHIHLSQSDWIPEEENQPSVPHKDYTVEANDVQKVTEPMYSTDPNSLPASPPPSLSNPDEPIQQESSVISPPEPVVSSQQPPFTPQAPEMSNASLASPINDMASDYLGIDAASAELFIPDSVITVTIPGGDTEFFYHDIGPQPVVIRGGFFVASDGPENPITFTILDPNGAAILRQVKHEAIFHVNTTMPGTYSFQLSNGAWRDTKYVTFGVTVGDKSFLTKDHLKNFVDNLDYVAHLIKDIHMEGQYLWGRQRGQMMRVEKSASWIFYLSLAELFIMFVIVAFELHFLKSLVANRYLF